MSGVLSSRITYIFEKISDSGNCRLKIPGLFLLLSFLQEELEDLRT